MARKISLAVLGLLCTLLSIEAFSLQRIWIILSSRNGIEEKVPAKLPAAVTDNTPPEAKRIAIIGAGAAGASSAYYLRQFLANSTLADKLSFNITVFERDSRIGGRAKTVNVYDDPFTPTEVGAVAFIPENRIIVQAAEDLALVTVPWAESPADETGVFGIFDGKDVIFKAPDNADWTNVAKLAYRYGPISLWKSSKLVRNTINKFHSIYHGPIFPFKSLTEAVEASGLLSSTRITAKQFMMQHGIKGAFNEELVQATTRGTYGQNIGLINGFQTMVSMCIENAVGIKGGNKKLFERMILHSSAHMKLSTEVKSLDEEDGKWTIKYSSTGEDEKFSEKFDAVIIAAPFQHAGIKVRPAIKRPKVVPYATVHVTLFTSPRVLDPTYFGLRAGDVTPTTVLTTLNKTEQMDYKIQMGEGKKAVGSPGFFSVTSIRELVRNGRTEYLYKVFSPESFSDDKVKQLLGVQEDGHTHADITWIYRHVWENAYPYGYPRVIFDDIKLARRLWNTGGIESLVSTLESSSLMGKNVAKLMIEEWEAESNGEVIEEKTRPLSDKCHHDEQEQDRKSVV